jgi:hypothetical protein
MSTLMSMYIEFGHETHLALVSVQQKEGEFVCQVRYMNSRIHYRQTESLLVFDLKGQLKRPVSLRAGKNSTLISRTIKAISRQLQTE